MECQIPIQNDNPDISVVVPTLPSRDIQSLPYLNSQSHDDYEVIVVDDSGLNICEARNSGIKIAKADSIALTDDDTKPPENWLDIVHNALQADGIHLVEGPVIGEENPERIYIGCNIGFTREAWRSVNGFDSRYAGWMDDTVFGWDVERAFGQEATQFIPEMKMEHIGPLRSAPIPENECLARREYTDRFFETIYRPESMKGRLFIKIVENMYDISPNMWDRILYGR